MSSKTGETIITKSVLPVPLAVGYRRNSQIKEANLPKFGDLVNKASSQVRK